MSAMAECGGKRSQMGDQVQVTLVKSSDGQLPAVNDCQEHTITHVVVYAATDKNALGFTVETGRTMRVALPPDVLDDLGRILLDLAEQRRLAGDV
jgi:hypothetical protein